MTKYKLQSTNTGGHRVSLEFENMKDLSEAWELLGNPGFKVRCSDGRAGSSIWRLSKDGTVIVGVDSITIDANCIRHG